MRAGRLKSSRGALYPIPPQKAALASADEDVYKRQGMTQLEGSESLTDAERLGIQTILGIKPSTAEISVTLKYKELTDYATLTEKSYTFHLKSAYAQNKTLAISTLYSLTEYSNIADFNAVYTLSLIHI